jgi:hypothetical protein
MPKVHLHDDQFDGKPYAWCGRGNTVAPSRLFEATHTKFRCKLCDKEWFPRGQPDWHLKVAQAKMAEAASL